MTGTELDAIQADPQPPAPLAVPRSPMTNPYWVYLAHFDSAESERAMRRCLDRIAVMLAPVLGESCANPGEMVPWEQLRYPLVAEIRKRLAQSGWSPSHVNKHLSALRGVARECWRLEMMGADDLGRIREVEQVEYKRELAGRNIPSEEMAAILAACLAESGPLGVRDAAMAALMHSTGLRRAEVASALIERYDASERALKVIGKGNKERTVYLHLDAVAYLGRWLALVGSRRGPLFRPVDRHGNISSRHLSARSVGHVVDERRTQAGLPLTSTHDFRRTFIGDFLDAGGDLAQAQALAGHASATTTAAYDRRPGRERRKTVDKLGLPVPRQLKKGT